MLTGSCKQNCAVFDSCGEYFQATEMYTISSCSDYENLKGCYGEKSCAEAIMDGAQPVESCAALAEEWIGTCEWTDQPDCDRQVKYTAYMIGCDAECRRTAPGQARYSCEGSGGKWTDL